MKPKGYTEEVRRLREQAEEQHYNMIRLQMELELLELRLRQAKRRAPFLTDLADGGLDNVKTIREIVLKD